MKKLMVTMLLYVAFAFGVQAQTTGTRLTEAQKQELKKSMTEYKEKLNLTPEQEEKVEAINMNYFEALSKIKEIGGSKLDKYKKFKRANEEKDSKMKGVLSNEQYKIYKEHQAQLRKKVKSYKNK
ncbi:hypothetical protein AAH994_15085 [Weeksellaceae bacterium A-14]